jgi:hypothetical protein
MHGRNFFATAAGFARSEREKQETFSFPALAQLTGDLECKQEERAYTAKGDERNAGRVRRVESLARGCALITQSLCANINKAVVTSG